MGHFKRFRRISNFTRCATIDWPCFCFHVKPNVKENRVQVSLKRLALRLFSFRYTSVPSKILWKSCFGNCFFLGLIAESQLRKVRKASSLSTKFLENNFCTNYFTLFFSGYQISTFVGLFFGAIFKRLNKMLKTAASPIKINQSCAFWTLTNLVRTLPCSFVENSPLEGDLSVRLNKMIIFCQDLLQFLAIKTLFMKIEVITNRLSQVIHQNSRSVYWNWFIVSHVLPRPTVDRKHCSSARHLTPSHFATLAGTCL